MDKDSTAIQKKLTAEVEQFKSAQKGNGSKWFCDSHYRLFELVSITL